MKFTIILCCMLFVQYALTFIQVRYFRKSMDKIISRYKQKEGYYLFSSMEKRKLGAGAMAMLIVDNRYVIQECYVVNGFSALSKFKEVAKYKGQHAGNLINEVKDSEITQTRKKKKIPAINVALSKAAENALLSVSKKNITIS